MKKALENFFVCGNKSTYEDLQGSGTELSGQSIPDHGIPNEAASPSGFDEAGPSKGYQVETSFNATVETCFNAQTSKSTD